MIEENEGFNYAEVRKKIHDAVNEAICDARDDITGVTGWILIAESASGQDGRNLHAISGDIIGNSDLPSWTARGWIAEISDDVSYYLGPDSSDEEEEDE